MTRRGTGGLGKKESGWKGEESEEMMRTLNALNFGAPFRRSTGYSAGQWRIFIELDSPAKL